MKHLVRHIFALTLLILLINCSTVSKYSQDLDKISVLQGYTTSVSSQFSVVTKKNRNLSFTVQSKNNKESLPLSEYKKYSKDHSKYVVHKFTVNNLKLKQLYNLKVQEEQSTIDQRTFASLDPNISKPTLLAASCLSDQENFKYAMDNIWKEALDLHKPDMIFLIGDTAYADSFIGGKRFVEFASPENLWQRYAETRLRVPLYDAKHLHPIVAIWDDHDFGKNNGGTEYIYKKEAKEIFETFFAQEEAPGLTKGPGVSFAISAFNQQFLFLDDRTFRSQNNLNSPQQTHWGAEQEFWLLKKLNKTKKPTWIINGDQIWADYHKFESYKTNHPKSFVKIMKKIGDAKSPVAFLTGDRHLTEVLLTPEKEFPYQSLEFTTSGVHAKLYPNPGTPLPKGVILRNDHDYSYAIIESKVIGNKLSLNLKSYGLGKKILFEKIATIQKSFSRP